MSCDQCQETVGCDGRQASRGDDTEVAEKLPADHVILTAGCAKFPYDTLDLDDVDELPIGTADDDVAAMIAGD